MNNTSKHKHLIIHKQLSFSQALMRVNSQPYSIFYYDLEDKVIKSLAIHQQRFKVSVSLARQAEHKYTTPTRMAKEQGEHLETTNRLIYKTGFIHPRICVNTGISTSLLFSTSGKLSALGLLSRLFAWQHYSFSSHTTYTKYNL